MIKCTACGTENPDGSRFCYECGSQVGGPVPCPACGHVNPRGAKFCNHCGTRVAAPIPAPAPAPVAVAPPVFQPPSPPAPPATAAVEVPAIPTPAAIVAAPAPDPAPAAPAPAPPVAVVTPAAPVDVAPPEVAPPPAAQADDLRVTAPSPMPEPAAAIGVVEPIAEPSTDVGRPEPTPEAAPILTPEPAAAEAPPVAAAPTEAATEPQPALAERSPLPASETGAAPVAAEATDALPVAASWFAEEAADVLAVTEPVEATAPAPESAEAVVWQSFDAVVAPAEPSPREAAPFADVRTPVDESFVAPPPERRAPEAARDEPETEVGPIEVGPINAKADVGPVDAKADVGPVDAKVDHGPIEAEVEVGPVEAEVEVGPIEAEVEIGPVEAEVEVGPVEFEPAAAPEVDEMWVEMARVDATATVIDVSVTAAEPEDEAPAPPLWAADDQATWLAERRSSIGPLRPLEPTAPLDPASDFGLDLPAAHAVAAATADAEAPAAHTLAPASDDVLDWRQPPADSGNAVPLDDAFDAWLSGPGAPAVEASAAPSGTATEASALFDRPASTPGVETDTAFSFDAFASPAEPPPTQRAEPATPVSSIETAEDLWRSFEQLDDFVDSTFSPAATTAASVKPSTEPVPAPEPRSAIEQAVAKPEVEAEPAFVAIRPAPGEALVNSPVSESTTAEPAATVESAKTGWSVSSPVEPAADAESAAVEPTSAVAESTADEWLSVAPDVVETTTPAAGGVAQADSAAPPAAVDLTPEDVAAIEWLESLQEEEFEAEPTPGPTAAAAAEWLAFGSEPAPSATVEPPPIVQPVESVEALDSWYVPTVPPAPVPVAPAQPPAPAPAAAPSDDLFDLFNAEPAVTSELLAFSTSTENTAPPASAGFDWDTALGLDTHVAAPVPVTPAQFKATVDTASSLDRVVGEAEWWDEPVVPAFGVGRNPTTGGVS